MECHSLNDFTYNKLLADNTADGRIKPRPDYVSKCGKFFYSAVLGEHDKSPDHADFQSCDLDISCSKSTPTPGMINICKIDGSPATEQCFWSDNNNMQLTQINQVQVPSVTTVTQSPAPCEQGEEIVTIELSEDLELFQAPLDSDGKEASLPSADFLSYQVHTVLDRATDLDYLNSKSTVSVPPTEPESLPLDVHSDRGSPVPKLNKSVLKEIDPSFSPKTSALEGIDLVDQAPFEFTVDKAPEGERIVTLRLDVESDSDDLDRDLVYNHNIVPSAIVPSDSETLIDRTSADDT